MKKIVSAVAALALVAMPVAGAQARPGKGPQSQDRQGAQQQAEKRKAADRRSEKNRGRSQRCKRHVRRGFVAAGTLAGHDADSVTLEVTRANRHARRWLDGNAPTFDTSDARFKFAGVTDATGDGAVDLADVTPTDRVRVIGKIATPKRGCDGDTTVTVRRVVVTRKTDEG